MGIDPGTNYMGYGILEIQGRELRSVVMGDIDLHTMSDPYRKLRYIFERATALLLGCIATLGVPFGLVTLLRRVINAPRPYEVYEFFDEPVENKSGDSFPSRHCFSIFAIGTLCLFASVPVGIFTLALGVVLCFCRVALGFHFVRDVVTGGIIGIISSLIGGFILIL